MTPDQEKRARAEFLKYMGGGISSEKWYRIKESAWLAAWEWITKEHEDRMQRLKHEILDIRMPNAQFHIDKWLQDEIVKVFDGILEGK
jgi:hypothetical protein